MQGHSTHNGYTASTINNAIERLIHNIEACFVHFDSIDTMPSLDEFKTYYIKNYTNKQVTTSSAPQTLTELIDEFTSKAGTERNWTSASYKKFTTLKNHIQSFRDIHIKNLNNDYLNEFLEYLTTTANLINTSAMKSIGCMRWLLRWAEENGFISSEYRTWHPRLKTANTKVIFLTWDELMRVYNEPLPHEYQRHVRDVFCFCCFSGLRYSDVKNLTHAGITEEYISITSIKDHEQLNINLNDYTREILSRYRNYDPISALPVISNQKYNLYIKEVMRLCKIDSPVSITHYQNNNRIDETFAKWELISTHTARKTFVCNALSLNIPVDVVMKWTGHSDYRAMKPYIDIADKVKASEMAKFNKTH